MESRCRRCARKGRRHRVNRSALEGPRFHRQGLQGKERRAWNAPHEQNRRHRNQATLFLVSKRADQKGRQNRWVAQAGELRLKRALMSNDGKIKKVSIIVSKGSLEGVYPGLIMANGARMEGIDANLFFTFFGLDAINKAKHEHVKVATVGNPGLHLATWAGGMPGVSSLVTHKLAEEMEKLDIPPIPEFVEMIAESGAGLYAC